MKKALAILSTIWVGLFLANPALALTAISLENDNLTKWESFADNKSDKKTQISHEKIANEKGKDVLKVKYFLDKESWCGILHHSMNQKWTAAKSISVLIRGTQDSMVRISFLDLNHVSYISEVQISAEWKTLTIPIEKFKQNPFFQPENAKKEKPLNLNMVYQMQFEPLTTGNGIFYLSKVEVNGILLTSEKVDNGVGAKSTVSEEVFETFERNQLINKYVFEDKQNDASINVVVKTRKNAKNKKNEKYLDIVYNSGKGEYGCGVGFGSSLGDTSTAFNAKGTTLLQVVANAPIGMKFQVSVNEAESHDGEKWTSVWQSGAGAWKRYVLPMNTFERNQYAGNQTGNNKFDLENVQTVEIEIAQKQGSGTIMVDDIVFQ
jgi:hypothetical protein